MQDDGIDMFSHAYRCHDEEHENATTKAYVNAYPRSTKI